MANNTVNRIRFISTDDAGNEAWRLLRLFKHQDYTNHAIRAHHQIEVDKNSSNIKKQADQIASCIIQAEEYFTAASNVTLATQPLLLYYGIQSLTQAIVLLKKDGSFSIDCRRKKQKHNHHGLDLVTLPKSGDPSQDFLDRLTCKVHRQNGPAKPDAAGNESTGIPWGHFPVVYDCLLADPIVVREQWYNGVRPMMSKSICVNTQKRRPIDDVDKLSLYRLLQMIPDMSGYLSASYLESSFLGLEVKARVDAVFDQPHSPNQDYTAVAAYIFSSWDVHPKVQKQALSLLATYPQIDCNNFEGERVVLFSLKDRQPGNSRRDPASIFPPLAEDLSGRKYLFFRPAEYLPEVAAHLAILFQLGMAARYHPDNWIPAIKNSSFILELISTYMHVVMRKVPSLVLDQMLSVKTVFTSAGEHDGGLQL